jgi:hypothetical protein
VGKQNDEACGGNTMNTQWKQVKCITFISVKTLEDLTRWLGDLRDCNSTLSQTAGTNLESVMVKTGYDEDLTQEWVIWLSPTARRTLFYSTLFGCFDVMNREYVDLRSLGSSCWWMYPIVWEPVGMCGCTSSVSRPHLLAVLHIHSAPSWPRIIRGSSNILPLGLSTTTLMNSVGVGLMKVSMAVVSDMTCCATCRVHSVIGMGMAVAVDTLLVCCCDLIFGQAWSEMLDGCLVGVAWCAC